MNGRDIFNRLAKQVASQAQGRGGKGGGGFPSGSGGFLTGSGLLVVLVGGGVALNASLFNGTQL